MERERKIICVKLQKIHLSHSCLCDGGSRRTLALHIYYGEWMEVDDGHGMVQIMGGLNVKVLA